MGSFASWGLRWHNRTMARYLPRPRKPPFQTLRTFLTNHLTGTAAIDFFTVPTATLWIFLSSLYSRTIAVVYCTSGG